jgi:hypothetical protein
VSVVLVIQCAYAVLIVICGLPYSTIFFPHYLINGTIFGKKCVFWFSLGLFLRHFSLCEELCEIL